VCQVGGAACDAAKLEKKEIKKMVQRHNFRNMFIMCIFTCSASLLMTYTGDLECHS